MTHPVLRPVLPRGLHHGPRRGFSTYLRSRMFIPSTKRPPADAKVKSHQLLEQGGFIRQVSAGIYTYLPLGQRVMDNIKRVIDDHMHRVHGERLDMPLLHSSDVWKKSGRWETTGNELMRLKDRKGHDFCLGPTHEEIITQLVGAQGALPPHRCPIRLYQIGKKFRDEARPRFGLIRGREFVMKDMYTFDTSKEASRETYLELCNAYERIFDELELPVVKVRADGGNIGGDTTHEFHALADIGEDVLLVCDGVSTNSTSGVQTYASNVEVAVSQPVRTAGVEGKAFLERDDVSDLPLAASMYKNEDSSKTVVVFHVRDRNINRLKMSKFLKNQLQERPEKWKIVEANWDTCWAKLCERDPNANVVCLDAGSFGQDPMVTSQLEPSTFVTDVLLAEEGDCCADTSCSCNGGGKLTASHGIEVGQAFILGTKYSEIFGAMFLGADQKRVPMEMGCYGIGVSRVMAAIVEAQGNHDDKGIVWPVNVSPFHAVFVPGRVPKGRDVELRDELETLAEEVDKQLPGFDVIVDDRLKVSFGAAITDAKRMGVPWTVIVGQDYLDNGNVELEHRSSGERTVVNFARIAQHLQET